MPVQIAETLMGDSQPSVAVIAPALPVNGAGGVASAHFNIHRCLRRVGCRTKLLTFNESERPGREPEVFRYGAGKRLRSLLAFGVHLYLKAIGSKNTAYQLTDIVSSFPGSLQVDHRLGRLCPDIIVIPDHGAPGLSLRNRGVPIILAVHHIPARFNADPVLGNYCPLDVAKATALEQRVLSRVAAVVCPSEYMKEMFLKTYAYDGEVTVIPNLVDQSSLEAIPAYDVRSEFGLSASVPVVYIPSAGSFFKGARYVFEIVRRLARRHEGALVFYLSGPIDPALRAELRYVPDNVLLFMPGKVSQETNVSYVKSCSFGVSPTLIESFGMAILEASYCRVPMVTFAVGGTPEIVRNGENGFLVPFLDIEGLIDSASKLLDSQYCDTLKKTTEATIRNRFNADRIALQYLSLFERCMRSGEKSEKGPV